MKAAASSSRGHPPGGPEWARQLYVVLYPSEEVLIRTIRGTDDREPVSEVRTSVDGYYPNLIPLSAAKVQRMAEMILEPFAFDAVYGSFSGGGQIDANGKQVVAAWVARYVARISEP
jgi:hypothetical protein